MYVHVPFCRRRCDYCAFATYTDRDPLVDRYVDACVTEIERAVAAGSLVPASSVFFGGGTPSRLPADAVARILAAVPRAPGCEVTVECNPEDAGPERFDTYRRAGVTRLSFGVQSTVPHALAALGRRHGADQARRAVALAGAAGFESFNVDLIFGVAGESADDWDRTLGEVLAFEPSPPHLSAYALTVEPGTPLARDRRRHPDEDAQADRYERTEAVLRAAGYRWEEISNWARPGHGGRHNRLYWRQGDYLGFGSAAHSHRAGHRWWNLRTPERYLAAVEGGRPAVAGEEWLDGDQRRFEALALALRTAEGVPERYLPQDPELERLVERTEGRAVLTVRGRLLANAVTARLQVGPEPGPPPGAAVGRADGLDGADILRP